MTQHTIPNTTGEVLKGDDPASHHVATGGSTSPVATQSPLVEQTHDPAHVAKLPPEDPLDFEHSDVSIAILLHQHDGDARGRLVSILIHNFSGPPVAQDFREADLSTQASLDQLQPAIALVMQRFFVALAERAQQKQAEQTKRASRTVTAQSRAVPPATPATASPTPSAAPASPAPRPPVATPRPAPPVAASQPGTEQEGGKKKDPGKPATKYQQYALF